MNKIDSLEKISKEIEIIQIENNPQAKQKLKTYVQEIYKHFKEEGITDWQKIKISEAAAAYKQNYFSLCAAQLIHALSNDITKDPLQINQMKKKSEEINIRFDLDKFIREL